MSSRLWTGEVPDPPLGPPPKQTRKRPAPNWTYTGALRKAPLRPLPGPRIDANGQVGTGQGVGPENAPAGRTGAQGG